MELSEYVDVSIVIICLVVGKIIKSVPIFEKLPNYLIVIILPVISIILKAISGDIGMDSIATALYSSLTAIGIHQTGKQSWTALLTTINSSLNKSENAELEDYVESNLDEEVEIIEGEDV